VHGYHARLKAGRVVRKGEKGIAIVAPVMGGDGKAKVVTIKPAYVFDVIQTDERTPRAAAWRPWLTGDHPPVSPASRSAPARWRTSQIDLAQLTDDVPAEPIGIGSENGGLRLKAEGAVSGAVRIV
jgi:hypothetical protein